LASIQAIYKSTDVYDFLPSCPLHCGGDNDHLNHRLTACCSVQVNIPAESGEMGILAQHVPSIEQLKPGLVEVIEESGGSKQFFREQEFL
jgi:hypothetical protein